MSSVRDNDQQSFLFVISGATPLTLTRNVPESSDDEDDDKPMLNATAGSWIGHAAKTIQRIIDELRSRAPRATVSVVTMFGGIEAKLQNVPIQCGEDIETSLSSIEVMLTSPPSLTIDLHEFLSKMNVASILKKSTTRPANMQFDQMYMFLCEEDVSTNAMVYYRTARLAPLVRWFILGPEPLRCSLASIRQRFAPAGGDFNVLECEDTLADDLFERLLPPPEEKPVLALGTKSAKFVIDPSSGIRTIEVLGFLPVGNISTSNLSQFSYDEKYMYEIGQDPDYEEVQSDKKRHDLDGDYFGSFPEPEPQLLALLHSGMIKEPLAAFCQVSLEENSEYLLIKQALAHLQTDVVTAQRSASAMEIDEGEDVQEQRAHLPVYGVIFATSKELCNYEPPDEVQEVESDEGPSDDDDIDEILEEADGKAVHLTLALCSLDMDRPGWPEMDQWTNQTKPFGVNDKCKFWDTESYAVKYNRWLDEAIFNRDVTASLAKHAGKKDYETMKKELADFKRELMARSMGLEMIDEVLDAVVNQVKRDKATVAAVLAMKGKTTA